MEIFLTDILKSNINQAVIICEVVEEAAEVLDIYAPIETFHVRKHVRKIDSPYLSKRTKLHIVIINLLKDEAAQAMMEDEFEYYKKKLRKNGFSTA